MENDEQLTSVMIRNIPAEVKRKFENYCTANGITIQEALRQYISSFYGLNDMQVITNTVIMLCNGQPDLVDQFIIEREPFYTTLQDGPHKMMMRQNFVSSNPSYIFKRYAEVLQERENTRSIPGSGSGY